MTEYGDAAALFGLGGWQGDEAGAAIGGGSDSASAGDGAAIEGSSRGRPAEPPPAHALAAGQAVWRSVFGRSESGLWSRLEPVLLAALESATGLAIAPADGVALARILTGGSQNAPVGTIVTRARFDNVVRWLGPLPVLVLRLRHLLQRGGCAWFHGEISSSAAATVLDAAGTGPGTFLVRFSVSQAAEGGYSVSLLDAGGAVRHYNGLRSLHSSDASSYMMFENALYPSVVDFVHSEIASIVASTLPAPSSPLVTIEPTPLYACPGSIFADLVWDAGARLDAAPFALFAAYPNMLAPPPSPSSPSSLLLGSLSSSSLAGSEDSSRSGHSTALTSALVSAVGPGDPAAAVRRLVTAVRERLSLGLKAASVMVTTTSVVPVLAGFLLHSRAPTVQIAATHAIGLLVSRLRLVAPADADVLSVLIDQAHVLHLPRMLATLLQARISIPERMVVADTLMAVLGLSPVLVEQALADSVARSIAVVGTNTVHPPLLAELLNMLTLLLSTPGGLDVLAAAGAVDLVARILGPYPVPPSPPVPSARFPPAPALPGSVFRSAAIAAARAFTAAGLCDWSMLPPELANDAAPQGSA
ncbi:uncharacterized protein AMSG_07517 [Thecamonas trahens ATCC 50062]|uniref:SH2 domain-containing protein n=1 Tax=Thecamonas trahens ATCC 50062 TaxID=461836 RepID=A0A0L0DH20_THETB|nr:hypothetical protein AMSG_07517 [Thecamonas trahens ATCC 50062]KNC51607.1 hypothetical protein AMSG_07517 [Thecamonas trahens ATCC 50062]|eukprot:XP_013756004.1 hypothetical protein AMSG_07517 [Thecamonas trahens ATCC 50062]